MVRSVRPASQLDDCALDSVSGIFVRYEGDWIGSWYKSFYQQHQYVIERLYAWLLYGQDRAQRCPQRASSDTYGPAPPTSCLTRSLIRLHSSGVPVSRARCTKALPPRVTLARSMTRSRADACNSRRFLSMRWIDACLCGRTIESSVIVHAQVVLWLPH